MRYEVPEINEILFDLEDVIATSNPGIATGGGDNPFIPDEEWWG